MDAKILGFFPGEVRMVFGRQILQYTKALCEGHYDYLEHLPDSLLLRIINYLELEDVGQLERTSRRFRQVSSSNKKHQGYIINYAFCHLSISCVCFNQLETVSMQQNQLLFLL